MQASSFVLSTPYSDHQRFPLLSTRARSTPIRVSLKEHPFGMAIDYLDWSSVQRLAMTSKGVHRIVHQAIRVRFQHLLHNWVEPVEVFMRLLEETGAVLVGDFVLAFLCGEIDPWGSPLQISVPDNDAVVKRFIDFLNIPCSYVHLRSLVIHPQLREVRRVFDGGRRGLRSSFQTGGRPQRIQIIQSSTNTATHPVPYMWNSALVNYISATEIVVGYPRSALKRVGYLPQPSYGLIPLYAKVRLAKHHFLLRTYRTHTTSGDELLMKPGYESDERRSFSDLHCMRMRICLGRELLSAGVLDPVPIHRQEHSAVHWQHGRSNTTTHRRHVSCP